MIRANHLALLLVPFLVVSTAACSGGDDGDSDAGGSPTAVASANVPAIADEGMTTVEIAELLAPSIVRVEAGGATIDQFGRTIPSSGVGTGFVIDADGHIVTNNHVVTVGDNVDQPASTINVILRDQRSFAATIVGRDPATDLAVLKIDADNLTPAAFGSSEELAVGQDVVAIGFALGLEGAPTVTRGVVSAKNRSIDERPYTIPDAIQTDAGINPGNSGGPLVNARGEVIGINTAIIRGAQNIGFAIASALARPIVEQLVASGRIDRAYLGVGTVDVTPGIVESLDLPVDDGLAVTLVADDSPAAAAGLLPNDVIVEIDGTPVANNGQLLAVLAAREPGDEVTLVYYRDGERRETTVTLAQRPDD